MHSLGVVSCCVRVLNDSSRNTVTDQVRANDVNDGAEEGSDSSKDEASSVSSYNPNKESLLRSFGSSLSLHSTTARSSSKDLLYLEENRTSLSLKAPPSQLSVADFVSDNNGGEVLLKVPIFHEY